MLIILFFKACVLHVGTNNFGNSPEEIVEGILTIVKEIRSKLPECSIILLVIHFKF